MHELIPRSSARRRWHPSQWNLTRVGVALGAGLGAGLVMGGCADDTTNANDGTDETDTIIGDGYSDWSDYADGYTDYTDYSDAWDYDDGYTDWSDDYDDGWFPECYVPEDCGPGWDCVRYYCVPVDAECGSSSDCEFDEYCSEQGSCEPVDLPSQCLAPAVEAIPLPAEAGGVVVALRFVELDGDPGRELVLVRDDAIIVVDGDQAQTIPHTGFALDGVAASDVDDDGNVDLVATSSTKLNGRVFLADGLGGWLDTGSGPALMLDDSQGFDWPTGGPGELLARNQADQPARVSNFAGGMVEVELLDEFAVEGVGVGDFDGNGDDDYAVLIGCHPVIHYQSGGALGNDGIGPVGPCSLTVGDFDQDARDDLVILRSDASFAVVTVFSPPDLRYAVGRAGPRVAAQATRFGGAGRSVLVQDQTELELLFADDQGTAWCFGVLDELPPVAEFVSGDFDGDGDEELAVLGIDGVVSLWSAL